jgi:hypothetical protein
MYRNFASIVAALLFLTLAAISHVAGELLALCFLIASVLMVHYGIQARELRFKTSIALTGACLLAWLAMVWIIGDIDNTLQNLKLAARLEASIGKDATSQFYVDQRSVRKYVEITSNSILIAAVVFFVYSIFSSKKTGVNKQTVENAASNTKKDGVIAGDAAPAVKVPVSNVMLTPAATSKLPVIDYPIKDLERLWERALEECDGPARKQGLWAKCFSEANGSEPQARANYLRERVSQIQEEIIAASNNAQRLEVERYQQMRAQRELEERKMQSELPKGSCPNCGLILSLIAPECTHCKADFGSHSSWKILPIAFDNPEEYEIAVAIKELEINGCFIFRKDDGWLINRGGERFIAKNSEELSSLIVDFTN